MNNEYKFDLEDFVQMRMGSGERGVVIGRAEFSEMDNQYFVRYVAADGRQVENWWSENAITAS